MNKSKKAKTTAALAALAFGSQVFAQNASITADFTAEKTKVSKDLFGIFYEDINYSADGGLYGEMVQNRSFEFQNSKLVATDKWTNVSLTGKSKSKIKASSEKPLNANNPVYGTINVKQAGDGISNKGYSGMGFEKGKTYPGSIYLRSPDSSITSVTITIGDSKSTSSVIVEGITNEWQKFEYSLIASATTKTGSLNIYANQSGTLNLDMISLFRADIYRNEPNGLRADLAQRLEDLHPAFVRFPGGCIVQGKYHADRYQWKDTIGPVEERKEKFNFWGYQQSSGLGFYEYFRLCEDIGAEPIPILNCGLSWEGENNREEDIPMNKMQPYVQDALDLIEYATGPADSTWGKKRAEAGHPEPFKLHYLGIGNEDGRQHYWERYELIAKAVKAKYPDIKLIISAGAFPNDQVFHDTWKQVRKWESSINTKGIANLIDEHYYSPAAWFLNNNQRYDDLDFYPRGDDQPHVFIGEFASWDDNRKNSVYAAITEAAYMTAIERNGDIVDIASYAPLFARQGKTQWDPDMIYFDEFTSYATPNYYVQQMFMTNKSDRTVKTALSQPASNEEKKYIGGTVGLATWSTVAEYKDITVTNNDTGAVIYDSNAGNADLSSFRIESGTWTSSDGIIRQESTGTNMRAILNNEKQMDGVANYTLNLKANKVSGDEGFLIMFGVKGKNLYWWNLGGWGNTQSAVEKGTADGRTTLDGTTATSIDTNRWYDIKIVVEGENYKCYLDGKLIHDYTDVMNFKSLYTHVGETDDGRVIIKIVNVSEKNQKVNINLNGIDVENTGTVTYLTGKPSDENSFAKPTKISPVTQTLSKVSSNFTYQVKPDSLTVIVLNRK